MSDEVWTLQRIEAERPDLAPLARLHRVLEATCATYVEKHGVASLAPSFPGPPAVHWFQGKALLEATGAEQVADGVGALFLDLAAALVEFVPEVGPAIDEIRAHVSGDAFTWKSALADFRGVRDGVPHHELYAFLLLRAIAVPARHLAHSYSAPHADRWPRGACPYCGLAAAAAVAQPGSNRLLLCVLCGGRWRTQDLACVACGERSDEKALALVSVEAGPASLEACGTCKTAIKVFADVQLEPGPPLAMEVLTAALDVLAAEQEGYHRDATAVAAIFPPA